MRSASFRRALLSLGALLLTSTCGRDTQIVAADWDEELPFWQPCGQFKTWETCPIEVNPPGCHWEKELLHPKQSEDVRDIGCLATQCSSDEDCNPLQDCRAINVVDCGPTACEDWSPSHYCFPLWSDEGTP